MKYTSFSLFTETFVFPVRFLISSKLNFSPLFSPESFLVKYFFFDSSKSSGELIDKKSYNAPIYFKVGCAIIPSRN